MQTAVVFLYLFKITAPLEETLRFLKQASPPAKDSWKAKWVILLDDMSVKPHSGPQLLFIPWTGTKYSGLPSNLAFSQRQLMSTCGQRMTPKPRKTTDQTLVKRALTIVVDGMSSPFARNLGITFSRPRLNRLGTVHKTIPLFKAELHVLSLRPWMDRQIKRSATQKTC
jgi:hypothetical protein